MLTEKQRKEIKNLLSELNLSEDSFETYTFMYRVYLSSKEDLSFNTFIKGETPFISSLKVNDKYPYADRIIYLGPYFSERTSSYFKI